MFFPPPPRVALSGLFSADVQAGIAGKNRGRARQAWSNVLRSRFLFDRFLNLELLAMAGKTAPNRAGNPARRTPPLQGKPRMNSADIGF